jgi:ribosome-associated protein
MQDQTYDESMDEIEIEAIGIEVDSQPIELYKVLKLANAVSGGGEAKYAISEGYVAVNGEIELRKRCKIYDGDLIEFNQEFYLLICENPVVEEVKKPQKQTQSKPKKQPKSDNYVSDTKPAPEAKKDKDKSGRSQIKFF